MNIVRNYKINQALKHFLAILKGKLTKKEQVSWQNERWKPLGGMWKMDLIGLIEIVWWILKG